MPHDKAIERFRAGHSAAVYARLAETGRAPSDDLIYLDCWLSRQGDTCFQSRHFGRSRSQTATGMPRDKDVSRSVSQKQNEMFSRNTLMQTDAPETFDKWLAHWNDLVDFDAIEPQDKPIGSELR